MSCPATEFPKVGTVYFRVLLLPKFRGSSVLQRFPNGPVQYPSIDHSGCRKLDVPFCSNGSLGDSRLASCHTSGVKDMPGY